MPCSELPSSVWASGDKNPDVPSFDGILPPQFIILIVGIKIEFNSKGKGRILLKVVKKPQNKS